MPLAISKAVSILEALAPPETAEDWDNVGLLLGDPAWKTSGAVISIDLTSEAIQEAKKLKYRLIVNHHPCIFPKGKGLNRITAPSLPFQALTAGIAVIACHTNFDQCALEVVKVVSKGLGVTARGRLHEASSEALLKLVTFVPTTHLEKVRKALSEVGAGAIGNYDSCSFVSLGEGAFRGGADTQPFIGKPLVLEKVQEGRLETIFPKGLRKAVISALFKAHPYEEVAYDLYPVSQGPSSSGISRGTGYGFWGELRKPKPLLDFARDVKRLFKLDGFMCTKSKQSQMVSKIGFVAGKGGSFTGAALQAGCDLFITGEAGYHTAMDAARRGLTVIELGHRESEMFFLSVIGKWLKTGGFQSLELDLATQSLFSE